jgi:GDP-L-fucose synthase
MQTSSGTEPTSAIERHSPVYVAGHGGLVGSAIVRQLEREGFTNILTATRNELDLRNQSDVSAWFDEHRPRYVFLVAGTVGGILANSTRPAEFIYDNMMIHGTVVHSAYETGVEKLLYLGSSCIYPRDATQPITEEQLLTGPLEETNEWYAIAKIAGIKLCQAYRRQYGCNFISAMPTNLYGPGDNFDLTSSHVIPALMRKFHDSRSTSTGGVEVWGTGSAMREFLHVDDLASACLFLLENYSGDSHINVGTGVDLSIKELAETIQSIVNPKAVINWDTSKPDGTPRKLLDISRLRALGWEPSITLSEGLESTYEWFLSTESAGEELRGIGSA